MAVIFTKRNVSTLGLMLAANFQGAVSNFDSFERGALSVFLMIFVVQLLIYGFHELTEANIFPYSEPLHIATEPYGPDGLYGKYLTYLLVVLPMGWLAFSSMFGNRKAVPAATQAPAQVN